MTDCTSLMLLGNKGDMDEGGGRQVTTKQGLKLAKVNLHLTFYSIACIKVV